MRWLISLIVAISLATPSIAQTRAGVWLLTHSKRRVVVSSSGGLNTFNPADKDANITLSNGNLTAAGPGSVSYRGVRGTLGMAADSGKYCWSYTYDSASVEADFGTANATFSTSADGRTSTDATVVDQGGNIYYTNNYGTTLPTGYSAGDTAMVCIDTASGVRKAWFARNGVFDGNPAAGTGGWALPTGTLYILFVTRHTDSATLNAAPSGKPSGFGNAP